MIGVVIIQLANLLNTKKDIEILKEVKRIFSFHYAANFFYPVQVCFRQIKKLYNGEFKGYRKCNTQYHDYYHTMDVFLASARLLDGYNLTEKSLPLELSLNLLFSSLFHDAGYLQEESDNIGTGGKYTSNHEYRSIALLKKHYTAFGIPSGNIISITNLIEATGLGIDFDGINFRSNEEMLVGAIAGTSDLLGQMADREYLEKLIFLYNEFTEAGISGYDTEYDIIKKTEDFYMLTKKRLETELRSSFVYAGRHFLIRYNIDENLYLRAIDGHIEYLRKIINDETTNFRHKLKRTRSNI